MAIDPIFQMLNSTIAQVFGGDNIIQYTPSTGVTVGQSFPIQAIPSTPKDQDNKLEGTYVNFWVDGNAFPAGVTAARGDKVQTDDGTFYSVKDLGVDAANGITLMCRVTSRPSGQ